MTYQRVLIYSWGTRGDVQPPLALALKLKELGKDVTMFVTPPSDEMVTKAGIPCIAASENTDGLWEALGTLDLSDLSVCNLIKTVRTVKAYQATPAFQTKLQADTKAGYELAMNFKPDVILLAGFEYGFASF